jgi:hypothetical protein
MLIRIRDIFALDPGSGMEIFGSATLLIGLVIETNRKKTQQT